MKVLGKVLTVQVRQYKKDGQEKQAADVVIMSGTDVLKCTMFDNDIKAGAHQKYISLVDKDAILDIGCEVFRGQQQYRLGFEDPRPVGPKAADKAA